MPPMPAARMTDFHICPMVTPVVPPIPHVGGPIVMGCFTVLIGGLPAARLGDLCVCVGPPDVVLLGEFTVLIGGQPAARMLDMTAHLGTILLGCFTVLIGASGGGGGAGAGGAGGAADPNAFPKLTRLPDGRIQVGDHIFIEGDVEFQTKALQDLVKLWQYPTGRKIISDIESGKHNTTIKSLDMATAKKSGALAGPTDRAGAKDPTKGSDTTISYNPDLRDTDYTDENGKSVEMPVQSTLAHEMIHATHNDKGTNKRDVPDPKDPTGNQEESQTIGINDHAGDPETENQLLKEMGAGFQRTDHDTSVHTYP